MRGHHPVRARVGLVRIGMTLVDLVLDPERGLGHGEVLPVVEVETAATSKPRCTDPGSDQLPLAPATTGRLQLLGHPCDLLGLLGRVLRLRRRSAPCSLGLAALELGPGMRGAGSQVQVQWLLPPGIHVPADVDPLRPVHLAPEFGTSRASERLRVAPLLLGPRPTIRAPTATEHVLQVATAEAIVL